MKNTNCDIIIPVFNKLELTEHCLKSIYENTHTSFNLILIDNGGDAGTKKFLEDYKTSHPNVELIRNLDNVGWVKAINQGIELSISPYICIMNNDTIVRTDDWISKLIEISEMEPDIGLVNPSFEVKKEVSSLRPFVEIDFCRGYCILIKRIVVEKIGLLDEAYGTGYYDDDDYSMRAIQAGFKCVKTDNVLVEHLRDSTFSSIFGEEKRLALHYKNKMLFSSKWGMRLRLLFIITKETNRQVFADRLLLLARKQHIVYLWNLTNPLSIPHINIREKKLPNFFYGLNSLLALYFNKLKKRTKQYDMIFVDNERLNQALSTITSRVYNLDLETDNGKIYEIVGAASKVKYEV